jgi:hemoglobin-like flavoprotein
LREENTQAPPPTTTKIMKLYCHAIEAAAESWKHVQALGNYQELVGKILFREIFKQAPRVLSMYRFGGTQQQEKDDGVDVPESVYNSPAFNAHAKGVVNTLEAALVMMLEDDLSHLALTLRQLGARHIEYGVLPQHYLIVETALLRTLEIGLKDEWTVELRKGWAAVFKFLSKAMLNGSESELLIVKEEQNIKERRILLQLTPKATKLEVNSDWRFDEIPRYVAPESPRWSPRCVSNKGLFSSRKVPFVSEERCGTRKNSSNNSCDSSPKLPLRSDERKFEADEYKEDLESSTSSSSSSCSSGYERRVLMAPIIPVRVKEELSLPSASSQSSSCSSSSYEKSLTAPILPVRAKSPPRQNLLDRPMPEGLSLLPYR